MHIDASCISTDNEQLTRDKGDIQFIGVTLKIMTPTLPNAHFSSTSSRRFAQLHGDVSCKALILALMILMIRS